MSFGHNVIAHAQSQTCPFTCWLGGKKGLKDLVFDVFGNTGAIVGDGDLNRILKIPCTYDYKWLIVTLSLSKRFVN